jgi:hypothetical protein
MRMSYSPAAHFFLVRIAAWLMRLACSDSPSCTMALDLWPSNLLPPPCAGAGGRRGGSRGVRTQETGMVDLVVLRPYSPWRRSFKPPVASDDEEEEGHIPRPLRRRPMDDGACGWREDLRSTSPHIFLFFLFVTRDACLTARLSSENNRRRVSD